MTNYTTFPKWRKNGIVIKFDDCRFSWCENTKSQRKYLLESNYCSDAVEFYVWENETSYKTIAEFKSYLKNKVEDEICPLCGKPLKLRTNRNDYTKVFWGCTGWPDCKYTKKA